MASENRVGGCGRGWGWRMRLLLLPMVLTGCLAGPQLITQPLPEVLPPRQGIEVWLGDRRTTLHGVRVDSDSLSGVPIRKPPECDTCRVAFSFAAIDSLRSVNIDRASFIGATLPPALFLGLAAVLAAGMQGD